LDHPSRLGEKSQERHTVIFLDAGDCARHPLAGMVLGLDVAEMGRGLFQFVPDHMREMELLEKETPQHVKPVLKVIIPSKGSVVAVGTQDRNLLQMEKEKSYGWESYIENRHKKGVCLGRG
jgi:hypothetical protein